MRTGGRVAEGTGLLTRHTERYREFESHPVRQFGLVVKWDNGGFASLNWEFDSPSVHKNSEISHSGRLHGTVNPAPQGVSVVQIHLSPPLTHNARLCIIH